MVGCWYDYVCVWQGADLHMSQLMPLPLTISSSSKSKLVLLSWFYLSGASSPGLSWTKSKRAIKWLCVCVCACACVCVCMRVCMHVCDYVLLCLQCFDAVGWVAGRAFGLLPPPLTKHYLNPDWFHLSGTSSPG